MAPTGAAEGAASLTVFVCCMLGAVACPLPLAVVSTPMAHPVPAVVGELNEAAAVAAAAAAVVVVNTTEEEQVLITEFVLHDVLHAMAVLR